MENYNREHLPSGEAATLVGGEVGAFPVIRQQRLRANVVGMITMKVGGKLHLGTESI